MGTIVSANIISVKRNRSCDSLVTRLLIVFATPRLNRQSANTDTWPGNGAHCPFLCVLPRLYMVPVLCHHARPPLRLKDHKFNLGVLVNPHFLELRINNNFFLTINYCWMFPFPMQAQTETNGKRDIRARHGARECVLHALRARYSRAMAHGWSWFYPFCTSFVTDLTTQNLTNTFEWPIKTRKLGFEEWQSLPAYPIWIREIYPYSIYFVIYTSCISEKRYYIKGICSLSELRSINLVDIAKVGLAVMVFPFNWWFFMLKFVPIFILLFVIIIIICDYWLMIVIQKLN